MNEIELLKNNLEKYQNIKALINENDIEKWSKKLSEYSNPMADYVEKSKFNILNCLILEHQYASTNNIITFLEDSLQLFPQLIESNSFKIGRAHV